MHRSQPAPLPLRTFGGLLAIIALCAAVPGQRAGAESPLFPTMKLPTVSDPRSVALADFDGDGVLDAAVGGSGSVGIQRGTGDGALVASGAHALGEDPVEVAAGDLDGDGAADVVATIAHTSRVIALLGDGHGGFELAPENACADRCSNPLLADLDLDGVLDLLTTHQVSATVGVHRGTGDGTFQAPTLLVPFGPGSPRSIQVGDVDRDGAPDVLVASWSRGTSLFRGNGDGTFQPAEDVPEARDDSHHALLADLDSDGALDLATTGGNAGGVKVLRGNGDGTFQASISYPATGSGHQLRGGDLDRNGTVDVVVMDDTAAVYVTLSGSGDGALGPPALHHGATVNSFDFELGDLDDDGDLDLVAPDRYGNRLLVLLGRGDGRFASPELTATRSAPDGVVLADMDADGVDDLVTVLQDWVPNEFGTGNPVTDLSVHLGRGDGTFLPGIVSPISSFAHPGRHTVADVDADGFLDVVVTNDEFYALLLLIGNGDGSFLPAVDLTRAPLPVDAEVADLDGDGIQDLVTSNLGWPNGSVEVRLGTGGGAFGAGTSYATGTQPRDVLVVDLDGDGSPEIVAANDFDGDLTVLSGRGDGTFEAGPSIEMGPSARSVAAADLDGDGWLDLVTGHSSFFSGESDPDVTVRLGRGDLEFAEPIVLAAGQWVGDVVVRDMDGDGSLDLVVETSFERAAAVFRGDGAGGFSAPAYFAAGDAGLAVADVDGDERLDILTADTRAEGVLLLRNQRPEATRICDADGNGAVDRLDLREILRSLGSRVGPGDPRDADEDGRVRVRDLRACRRACDLARCEVVPACGLLGIELLPLFGWIAWRRRRRGA